MYVAHKRKKKKNKSTLLRLTVTRNSYSREDDSFLSSCFFSSIYSDDAEQYEFVVLTLGQGKKFKDILLNADGGQEVLRCLDTRQIQGKGKEDGKWVASFSTEKKISLHFQRLILPSEKNIRRESSVSKKISLFCSGQNAVEHISNAGINHE